MEYARFMDSKVLKTYAGYLTRHRATPDGNVREPDNWKKGIPTQNYVDSLWRHLMDVWLWSQDHESEMAETIEDSLCAILFNAHGLLYELQKGNAGDARKTERQEKQEKQSEMQEKQSGKPGKSGETRSGQ
jgi:hypothetical protein